jgi:hypothetical protein
VNNYEWYENVLVTRRKLNEAQSDLRSMLNAMHEDFYGSTVPEEAFSAKMAEVERLTRALRGLVGRAA